MADDEELWERLDQLVTREDWVMTSLDQDVTRFDSDMLPVIQRIELELVRKDKYRSGVRPEEGSW